MPKRTIYLSDEDAKFWDVARRAINAESGLGIGAFVTRMLNSVVKVVPAQGKQRKKQSIRTKK